MEKPTYYKLIKLSSGDNIICTTDDDCKDFIKKKMITVHNPVVLNTIRLPRGTSILESYILIPWFSFSESEIYDISTQQIVTTSNLKEGLVKNYKTFLENRDSEDEEEETKDITVEELQEEDPDILQELMDTLAEHIGEQSEEEEQDGRDEYYYQRDRRRTRTIH